MNCEAERRAGCGVGGVDVDSAGEMLGGDDVQAEGWTAKWTT